MERKIAYCKIHPGIGIARIGDSPEEYFIGPESLVEITEPEGGFKDAEGRIKRQACRFRIYGYDEQGKPVKEITLQDADITWRVSLANTKASWHEFKGLNPNGAWRNSDFKGDARSELEINPGERSISGINQGGGSRYKFDGGKFLGVDVPLGELKTDESGCLLMLGGHGFSSTTKENNPLTHYANNDYWHDDVSDGPVSATIKFKSDGTEMQAMDSWVIVAAPKYAPDFQSLITLYDVAFESAVKNGWINLPEKPSFTEDIYPIFKRVIELQWLNKGVLRYHRLNGTAGDFVNLIDQLADNTSTSSEIRERIFKQIRNPNLTGEEAIKQANREFMPPMSGDAGDAEENNPETWLKLTKTQYYLLEKWSRGDFESDWNGPPNELHLKDLPVEEQPKILDKTGLALSVGGAFFPGIESTWIMRYQEIYAAPFRIKSDKYSAGEFTKRMAVPWQADFYECTIQNLEDSIPTWWPSHRPNDIMTEQTYKKLLQTGPESSSNENNPNSPEDANDGEKKYVDELFAKRDAWDRGIGDTKNQNSGKNDMVKKWSQLGFLKKKTGLHGETYYVESERGDLTGNNFEFEGLTEREYFYILMNIDTHDEYLPQIRRLAQKYLNESWLVQDDPQFPKMYRFFDYTPEIFEERMQIIYDRLVFDYENFDIDKELKKYPRKFIIERAKQAAPFNLIDGAWIQNVAKAGPIDEVRAGLFSIWADEAGNGNVEHNHSNVYRDFLHGLGVYMPETSSRAFADQKDLWDESYSNPVMQLAISQFPNELFPEIIGMTLYLEWEATPTLSQYVQVLKERQIDPHFYSLHVAIDNIASGHGAIAKDVVKIYLDKIRREAGEEAAQQVWKRIWNGYICFLVTGGVGDMLLAIKEKFDESPEARKRRMIDLIRKKAPVAKTAHGKAWKGDLNKSFENPEELLEKLVAQNIIVPGEPENSRFLELLSFQGPMYKVFTEQEIEVIRDYIISLKDCNSPIPVPTEDTGVAMRDLINDKAVAGRTMHPEWATLTRNGETKPINKWFDEPEGMMEALIQSNYIVPKDVLKSKFWKLINSGGPMERFFNDDERKIIENWIREGCPNPKELQHASFLKAIMNYDPEKHNTPPKVWGLGMVH